MDLYSMALHEIGWRHDKLLEILHSYVMKMRTKLNTYYISLILNAYAALVPDQIKYLNELGPELHDRLAKAVNTETFRLDPRKGDN
jgi:predicted ATP-binding protein involved in virulence